MFPGPLPPAKATVPIKASVVFRAFDEVVHHQSTGMVNAFVAAQPSVIPRTGVSNESRYDLVSALDCDEMSAYGFPLVPAHRCSTNANQLSDGTNTRNR